MWHILNRFIAKLLSGKSDFRGVALHMRNARGLCGPCGLEALGFDLRVLVGKILIRFGSRRGMFIHTYIYIYIYMCVKLLNPEP